MQFSLYMTDDFYGDTTERFEAADLDAALAQIPDKAGTWAEEGEWGDDGEVVDVRWWLSDDTGELVDEGLERIEIEPNHRALIQAAGGNPDCDHDWSDEGEGGHRDNPGVWSLERDRFGFDDHCTRCGLHRSRIVLGSQRDPGEHDTVRYTQPDAGDDAGDDE